MRPHADARAVNRLTLLSVPRFNTIDTIFQQGGLETTG